MDKSDQTKELQVKSLIESYKKRIANTHLKDEKYKWELVNLYRGRPDTNAVDFQKEIKDIKFMNMVYAMGIAVLNELSKHKTEELRNLFRELFDENKDLKRRIESFDKGTLKIYRDLGKTNSHHQDERSIATYLTFNNPDKYTFFKSSFYSKYCELLGIKKAKKNEKYVHYLSLINDLVENYIKKDTELIEQVKSLLPEYYDGTNHNLLAQDILFQMLDGAEETNYWIFQGNPKVFDFETALRENILTDWTVSAHKDKIKKGDKVILWITGGKPGCYALAEIVAEPHEKSASPDDHLWKSEDKNSLKADIKITHNLVDRPILKEEISDIKELKDLKVGNQGTNFQAAKKEFDKILEIAMNKSNRKYWLYAPGENANKWNEFFENGIMALGWDNLGDLNKYANKEEIRNELQKIHQTESGKMNDTLANYEFKSEVNIGDIVIAKKGTSEYLGYGIVTSDYYFDNSRLDYKSCRKIDWKKKGIWIEENGPIVLKTLTDITKYPDYVNRLIDLIGIEKENKVMLKEVIHPLNTIFYGPPGTGKTYNTVLRAAEIVENRTINSYNEALQIFKSKLHDQIEFITFHQNYSYEDFIQGLRPDTENDGQLSFEKKDGVFKIIADKALKNLISASKSKPSQKEFEEVFNEFLKPLQNEEEIEVKMIKSSYFITGVTKKSIEFRKSTGESAHSLSISTLKLMYDNQKNEIIVGGLQPYYNPLLKTLLELGKSENIQVSKQNYVIIIDEINRANISRVFGELITLIEPDKRSHGNIPMEVKLPSGDTFIVPSNLYIIGTMNTADKSIALLDIALRRRFEFESMYPRYEIEGQEIYDIEVLKKINEQIIKTKGHDFQIDHAYFMGDNSDLVARMNKKVIPLLLEYFMNDEKEVKEILKTAGLVIEENSWPIRISGRNV
jgi:hypothetical protein